MSDMYVKLRFPFSLAKRAWDAKASVGASKRAVCCVLQPSGAPQLFCEKG